MTLTQQERLAIMSAILVVTQDYARRIYDPSPGFTPADMVSALSKVATEYCRGERQSPDQGRDVDGLRAERSDADGHREPDHAVDASG